MFCVNTCPRPRYQVLVFGINLDLVRNLERIHVASIR